MYIEKISIKSFGAIKDYECDFTNGINVIEGPNESGKSTIGAFIKFVFFGLSTDGTDGAVSERKKYQSLDSDSAAGYAVYECGGKRYKTEREIIPALNGYGKETVKTTDLETGEECLCDTDPGVYFFGVNGDVFAQSAYVNQTSGTAVKGRTVSDAIDNMLFSGNELISTKDAGENLDKARFDLLLKNKKGGVIYELCLERDELARRIERAKADNSAYFAFGASVRALKAEDKLLDDAIHCHECEISACEASKKLEKINALEQREERVASLESELEAYKNEVSFEGFIPDAEYHARLSALAQDRALISAELDKAKAERSALGGDKIDADDRAILDKALADGGSEEISEFFDDFRSKSRFRLVVGIFMTVFALLWGALGAVCLLVKPLAEIELGGFKLFYGGFIAVGIAALMLILSIVFFAISRGAAKKIDKKLDHYGVTNEDDIYTAIESAYSRARAQEVYVEELSAADKKCTEKESELAACDSEISELCSKWGKDTLIDTLEEIVEEAGNAVARIAGLENDLRTERTGVEAMKQALGDYDKEALEASVTAIGREITPELEENAAEQIKQHSEKKQKLFEDLRNAETELARLGATAEDISALSDSYDELCARIAQLEMRHAALALASSTLVSAGEDLRNSVSPRLSMQASEYMRRATADKYGSLGITSELGVRYAVNTKGLVLESRESDYMSEGTRDLAYISLRLALVGFLYRRQLPPLVFDEAFSRLDDNRIKGALSVVSDYAEHCGQVFLFTSQKREGEITSDWQNTKLIHIGE